MGVEPIINLQFIVPGIFASFSGLVVLGADLCFFCSKVIFMKCMLISIINIHIYTAR